MKHQGIRIDDHAAQLGATWNKRKRGSCLLPTKYALPDYDTRIRFVYNELKTFDPATDSVKGALIRKYEPSPHLEWMTYHWCKDKSTATPLIIKKTRRMMASWLATALELHDALLRQTVYYIGCQNYDDSAEMVWRFHHLYSTLRSDRPEWKLEEGTGLRYRGERALSTYTLPNGSIFKALTGEEPSSFRQEGATGIRLEEAAFFPRFKECWSNAITMCSPSSGVGGHAVAISTANPESEDWHQAISARVIKEGYPEWA